MYPPILFGVRKNEHTGEIYQNYGPFLRLRYTPGRESIKVGKSGIVYTTIVQLAYPSTLMPRMSESTSPPFAPRSTSEPLCLEAVSLLPRRRKDERGLGVRSPRPCWFYQKSMLLQDSTIAAACTGTARRDATKNFTLVTLFPILPMCIQMPPNL